jgi:hypothetical protein
LFWVVYDSSRNAKELPLAVKKIFYENDKFAEKMAILLGQSKVGKDPPKIRSSFDVIARAQMRTILEQRPTAAIEAAAVTENQH